MLTQKAYFAGLPYFFSLSLNRFQMIILFHIYQYPCSNWQLFDVELVHEKFPYQYLIVFII